MTIEKFKEIEALVKQHQQLTESHDFVITTIETLENTNLPGLSTDSKRDLIGKLYKTAGSHFHPEKQAVRDQLEAIKNK